MYKGYIYKWKNKINGKVYIGQTMNRYGYKERWSQHLYTAKHTDMNNYFYNAIRKYGVESFDRSVLETIECDNKCALKSILDKLEIKYIKEFDSYKNGYNSTLGGDFNVFSSGDEEQVKIAKEKQKETRARNILDDALNDMKIKFVNLNTDRNYLYNKYNISECTRFRKSKQEYETSNFEYLKYYNSRNNDYRRSADFNLELAWSKVYSIDELGIDTVDNHMYSSRSLNYKDVIPNDHRNNIILDIKDDIYDDFELFKSLLLYDLDTDDVQNDLWAIKLDIENIIDNMEFNDKDFVILEMFRKGMKQYDISEHFNCSKQNILISINKIVKNIIKKYNEIYEDSYYYLYKEKGQYKRCSKCGEIKLTVRFDKESKGKDGYKIYCRCCRKVNKIKNKEK